MRISRGRLFIFSLLAALFMAFAAAALNAQLPDQASVIQHIDSAIRSRFDHVASFTVTEHYSVLRDSDKNNPMAEMTVKTYYQRDTGKTYTILSQTGSSVVKKMAFEPLLDTEKRVNEPANREAFWFTSANYEMKLQPGTQPLNGHTCYVLAISPKHKAPNLIEGTLWVDVNDYSTVQIQGVASKSPSVFAGPAHMMRQYANVAGYPQATHARAETNAFLIGKIVITIDYSDYQVQLRPIP
ncbi:MAG: hypothetical protein ABR976_03940 [Terracidiphilus sp.]|jgi:hypothetical protein